MHVTPCTYQVTVRNNPNNCLHSEFFPIFNLFYIDSFTIGYLAFAVTAYIDYIYIHVYTHAVSLKFLFRYDQICVTKFTLQESRIT